MHLLLWHWMICLEVTSLLLSDTYCNQIERILFLVLHLCSDFIAALYSSFHVTQMWMAWCFFSTNVLVWYSFQSLNAVVWLECSIGLDCYYDSFSHCLKVRNHFCCTDYILSVSLSLSVVQMWIRAFFRETGTNFIPHQFLMEGQSTGKSNCECVFFPHPVV